MASRDTANASTIAQVMNEDFIRKVLDQMHTMLVDINGFERFLFDEYDEFINDVEALRASLLKFVLNAKVHLKFLTDVFNKPRYQQGDETAQVQLIKDVLNEIDRDELANYLSSCHKLITTTIRLHSKYGSKTFKVKFVLCKVFNFMAIGAVVGAAVGLALPFLAPVEAFTGAVVGLLAGFACGLFQLLFHWDEQVQAIEKIRCNLVEIQAALGTVIQQMHSTQEKLGIGKVAAERQAAHAFIQDANSLEEYVKTTLNEFNKLEGLLLRIPRIS